MMKSVWKFTRFLYDVGKMLQQSWKWNNERIFCFPKISFIQFFVKSRVVNTQKILISDKTNRKSVLPFFMIIGESLEIELKNCQNFYLNTGVSAI